LKQFEVTPFQAALNIVYAVNYFVKGKGKEIQLQAWGDPGCSSMLRLQDFKTIRT
jgi:hypothetical protein